MTRRLLASYLLITALVLVVLEVPLGLFFQQRQLDRLTADTERDATVLMTAYEDDLERDQPLDPFQAQVYAERTGVRVVIVDAEGIAVVDTGNEIGRDFSTRTEFIAALQGERATGTRRSETLGAELLYVAVPVASGGVVHGALRLTIDTHEVTEQIRKFWWGLCGIAALVLLMVVAVGWATARSISRPILQLHATAVRFSSGDLAPAPPVLGAPPEIEQLDEAMSTMARRLDRLLQQQRSFVADASHQLRTPLTGLRLRLENLEATTSDPGMAEELNATIAETDRLSALVSDLLQLATAERPSTPVDTPLGALAAERVDTWTALAEQSNVTLSLVEPVGLSSAVASPHVLAVPGAVEQILDNLIDNAIHALEAQDIPGAQIEVSLTVDPTTVALSVADNGPGLDADQRDHAVERFWRGGDSADSKGSGLGLAIVKGLTDASGAHLRLASNDAGGLTVTVGFRRTTPEQEHRVPNLARGPRRDASKR
ncbi:MAG: ATP-binding protein [Acidimicrobiales bacterium]